MSATCTFCPIIAGDAPATVIYRWKEVMAILPRSGGVTPGHTLVIPHKHVPDVGSDPAVAALTMAAAAELAADLAECNVITSQGPAATQTVEHLHLHVVPRREGDGLALPWSTPQAERTVPAVRLVMAREPIPTGVLSVFLAGPTPVAGSGVTSWRTEALAELRAQWSSGPLTVLSPESRGGRRASFYDHQVDWETRARAQASAILFWIPRDMKLLPGLTTNVEFGLDVGTGRVVLGCPPDAPDANRNRYPIYVARRFGVPVRNTLEDTVRSTLALLAARTVAG